MKRKGLVVAGVLLLGLIIFVYVSRRTGNVRSTLDTQSAALTDLSETLNIIEKGLPGMIGVADDTRAKLAQFRGNLEELQGSITSQNFNTVSMAYAHAEKGVTGSITLMKSAALPLQSYRSALELLEENHAALRAIFIENAPRDDGTKAREKITDDLTRTGQLLDIGERISEDLGRFVVQQEKQWLDMHQQMKNLEDASQGDAEVKELTHALVTLLEVEGAALENARKTQAFCENFPKKLRHEMSIQTGLLSIAK